MAIFAKKKHGRRQNEGGADDAAAQDIVHIEVPDRHANDGVLTKATIGNPVRAAQAAESGATQEAKQDPAQDTPSEVKADRQTDGTAGRASDATVDAQAGAPAEQLARSGVAIPGGVAAAGTEAPAAENPVPSLATAESATAAPEIEPVDIEPEVIEAPAEPPLVFGITDAIRLMRSLPADPNIDLVVRVVRVTLSAVNVSVDDILRDAEKKELKVRESIAALEDEVAALEKTLHEKRASIAAHQADLRETATVRERLHLADKYTPHPPPLPPGVARVPLPKPREWESFDADHPFKTKDS
jgi:hypothetical protein